MWSFRGVFTALGVGDPRSGMCVPNLALHQDTLFSVVSNKTHASALLHRVHLRGSLAPSYTYNVGIPCVWLTCLYVAEQMVIPHGHAILAQVRDPLSLGLRSLTSLP